MLVFVVIIFVLLVGPLIIFFNLDRTILSGKFIKTEFAKINIYERILSVDPNEIIKSISGGDATEEELSSFDLKKVFRAIPEEELKKAFESNLDQATFSLTQTNRNDIQIDLASLKSSVARNSSDPNVAVMMNTIKDSYVYPLPESIVKKRNLFLRLPLYFSIYAVVVGMLFVFAFLLAKGLRTKFRVTSLLLLISGIFCAISYAAGRVILALPVKLPLPDVLNQIKDDLVIAIKNDVLKLFLYESIGFILLALAFFLVGFLFKKQEAVKPETPAPKSESGAGSEALSGSAPESPAPPVQAA